MLKNDPPASIQAPSAYTGFIQSMAGGQCVALGAVAILTTVAIHLLGQLAPTNIAMLYLLLVVVLAVRHSRAAAVTAAITSVLCFDFFFVPPRLSFAVSHVQYLLTFAVMLGVGLIAAQLTAGVRRQAELAARRADSANALHRFGGELASCVEETRLTEEVHGFFSAHGARAVALWVNDRRGLRRLLPPGVHADGTADAPVEVRTALASNSLIKLDDAEHERGADTPCLRVLWPLKAPMRQRGVLALSIDATELDADRRSLFDSAALLIAISLERLHYVDVAHVATLEMEKEKLRTTILSALSHDIRTPLTVLVGMADALAANDALPERERAMASAMQTQALRLSGLSSNLLELARLHSGREPIHKEWQSVEEIVGSALAYMQSRTQGRRIELALPAELPLVEFDAVLIERVLCNLLENALRHCPSEGVIRLSAEALPTRLQITVEDEGPGLEPALVDELFQPFGATGERLRGTRARTGLGLAICKAIVDAHDGDIVASNRAQGGARFTVSLPRGEAPAVDIEQDGSEESTT